MAQRVSGDGVGGDPNHPTAVAIRRAAAELFTEHSPASVSLRQIAARAGVNYGLIHHYFRTKEKLIGEVFADFSAQGAERIRDARNVRDALRALTPTETPSLYPHMLAWAVLDGSAAKEFQASAAFRVIRTLIEQERADGARHTTPSDPEDDRVITAAVMAAVLGWQFFMPFVRAAGELGDIDHAQATDRMIDLLSVMTRAATAGEPDATA